MKIAIIGEIHSEGWKTLKKYNCNAFEIVNFEKNNLKKELKDVDGTIIRAAPHLTANILEGCNNIKIIARHGVGYDNIDLEYLNQNNIALGVTGTSNAVSVAEQVLTSFLYLTKNIHQSDQLTRSGGFNKKSSLPDFFELYKKNVVIFGFGRIGKAVAKRCLAFETNVYVYDPFIDKNEIEKHNCKIIDKIDGIKIADYLTIHLPLNNDTKNFISLEELSIMKNTAIIVNSARGGIINEHSLFNALKNKKILGAALDVFEKEPPEIDNPLFGLSNVLLSPHNAALTLECRKRMAVESAENIINFLSNREKLNKNNIINKEIFNF
ncbi:hydroxyacid dehydrogenase [Pelagibacteraceae bacterium]|nr:hydroxyacid dehydrogenase [Pelagibacteraceae bacterium]